MSRGLHWFRNDLRLRDNTALAALATRVDEWLPVFVFDPRLWPGASAARERFMLDCLERLGVDLARRGAPLVVREGLPHEVLPRLLHETGATVLSFNEDVTPFALERDAAVRSAVEHAGVSVVSSLDHVVRRSSEVRTQAGGAYSVYTPYRNRWWSLWRDSPRLPQRAPRLPAPIAGVATSPLPEPVASSAALELPLGGEAAAERRLRRFLETQVENYAEDRDRPDRDATSRLSPYLRFGVLSVRRCFQLAEEAAAEDPRLQRGVEKWLDELIWREFYSGILEEHPKVLRENYRKEFDAVVWNDDSVGFEAWCAGRTGYPIVDAGMRQLLATGWMHNRVRMIVASFLTKSLLIDWRHGERFFFEQLVDGDPASNNGGWQWAASTGTDAQPYFRILNPVLQGRRFDPDGTYVRRWVPELRDFDAKHLHSPWESPEPPADYAVPCVDHSEGRDRALERFGAARRSEKKKK